MNKKMFKYLSLILVLAMTSVTVSAQNMENNNGLWQEVYEEYLHDEMFQMHLRENYESAIAMIDRIVEARNEISICAGPLREPNCVVPLIQQINYYYCGPASALQAIYGFGCEGMVSGANNAAKQQQLASNMGTTPAKGTYVYRMVDELNNYLSNNTYVYKEGGEFTGLAEFQSDVSASLFDDRPVIVHASTSALDYYEGYSTGHYIVVDTYYATELASGTVGNMRVQDCNNDSDYFGTHSVPSQQLYNSISGGRYLIYAP